MNDKPRFHNERFWAELQCRRAVSTILEMDDTTFASVVEYSKQHADMLTDDQLGVLYCQLQDDLASRVLILMAINRELVRRVTSPTYGKPNDDHD